MALCFSRPTLKKDRGLWMFPTTDLCKFQIQIWNLTAIKWSIDIEKRKIDINFSA